MTGNNTMTLNQATVIEAVQMYLDSKFKEGESPLVDSVKAVAAGHSGTAFEVMITDRPEATKAV